MSVRFRRLRWLLVMAIVVLLFLATYPFWLGALGSFLVRSEAPVPADMIVVLAGDFTGGRVCKAGDLVRQGLAPKALISGPTGIYGMDESDLAIRLAVRKGYPESYFVPYPNNSKSTASESQVLAAQLRKLGVHKIDLVTSNFHTRRAGNIFRGQAPEMEVHVVESPDPYFTPNGWWKDREGRKTFLIEWMKTVAAWIGA